MRRLAIVVAEQLLLFAACTPPTPTPEVIILTATPEPRVEPSTPTPATATTTISWDEARSFVGQLKTVCGPVAETFYATSSSGKPTFLNIGRDFPNPDRFTVVIWERNRSNFPTAPEQLYRGKTICVSGVVDTFKGVVQIEAESPSQIETQ